MTKFFDMNIPEGRDANTGKFMQTQPTAFGEQLVMGNGECNRS